MFYKITKNEFKVQLKVKSIKLNVYKTGIGILSFELENHESTDINAVLKINEFGRRIFLPYISDFDNSCSVAADTIELTGFSKCDFKAVREVCTNESISEYQYISPIVTELLGSKFSFYNKKAKIKCELTDDDRMFVISCVDDREFLAPLVKWNEKNHKYQWQVDCIEKDFNEQSKLYEFLFIDGDGLTCIDRNMRLKLLEKHLYTRWIGYYEIGSIHGITHHSMVLATDAPQITFTPFINCYTKMASLVLVQRASIIAMSKQAAEIAKKINGNVHVEDSNITEILSLQRKYVKVQNQILSFEATAQEQGIEIYDMLQSSLYINKEQEQLDKQLCNLYQIASMDYEINNLQQDKNSNMWLAVFTISATGIAFIQLICVLFNWNKYLTFGSALAIVIAAWGVAYSLYRRKKRH